MSDKRKLARHVTVAGTTYGPGDTVPEDVAEKITNPKAWIPLQEPEAEPVENDGRPAGTSGGHKLAATVSLGGKSYGPRDFVPDDIAARITNPKAWQDGKVPAARTETADKPDTSEASTKKAAPVKAAGGDKQ